MNGRAIGADAADRVRRARAQLVMRSPFFGALALLLDLRERPDVETMATDGRAIYWSRAFVDGLADPELVGVLAHETYHCAARHFSRRGARDPERWNVATDHAINLDLIAAGFTLPRGRLADPGFAGMPAESIYAALAAERAAASRSGSGSDDPGDPNGSAGGAPGASGSGAGDPSASGSGAPGTAGAGDPSAGGSGPGGQASCAAPAAAGTASGGGSGSPATNGRAGASGSGIDPADPSQCRDPGACGGIIDPASASDPAEREALDSDWRARVTQALAVARAAGAGDLPGYLERLAAETAEPRTDWRSTLRAWIDGGTRFDFSWTRPNRRHVARGVILPGSIPDGLAHLVVAVDTSGSISPADLAAFESELSAACEEGAADLVSVVYADRRIHRVDTFHAGDPVTFRPRGGGGTGFRPVMDWIRERAPDASGVVFFTDLDVSPSGFGADPGPPVLWAACGDPRRRRSPPFGDVVEIAADA